MSKTYAAKALQFLAGRPLVIFAAGGGAEAISDLQAAPGCSKVLVDARVPYSRKATRDLVGRVLKSRTLPDGTRVGGATSAEAALLLSWSAWQKAAEYAYEDGPLHEARGMPVGAAATCTLSGIGSERKHGDEAWLAVRTGVSGATVYLAHMAWEVGQTEEERDVQSRAVGDQLLRILAGDDGERSPAASGAWTMVEAELPSRPPLPSDLGRTLFWDADSADSVIETDDHQIKFDPESCYLLPGSFNPMTSGHVKMKLELDRATGKCGIFQISATHPSKGLVPAERLNEVANACRGVADLVVTAGLGMYLDKVQVLGLDVACGEDAIAQVSEAHLRQIAGAGRKLLVVTRPGYELSPDREALLRELGFPRYTMEFGISSTALRAALKQL